MTSITDYPSCQMTFKESVIKDIDVVSDRSHILEPEVELWPSGKWSCKYRTDGSRHSFRATTCLFLIFKMPQHDHNYHHFFSLEEMLMLMKWLIDLSHTPNSHQQDVQSKAEHLHRGRLLKSACRVAPGAVRVTFSRVLEASKHEAGGQWRRNAADLLDFHHNVLDFIVKGQRDINVFDTVQFSFQTIKQISL